MMNQAIELKSPAPPSILLEKSFVPPTPSLKNVLPPPQHLCYQPKAKMCFKKIIFMYNAYIYSQKGEK